MELISRELLENKMIPFIAELFKEDETVPIAKGLLQALADEPTVMNVDRDDDSTEETEEGENK